MIGLCNKKRIEKYFDVAVDGRKFEIGLFWQRSLFFWGFIAAAFVSFAQERHHWARLWIACFGFVCSFAWVLLNLGGKYWHEAWEQKVERKQRSVLVEPLFGGKFEPVQNKGVLFSGRRYSVSKLIIALSYFTTLVWSALLIGILPWHFSHVHSDIWQFASAGTAVAFAIVTAFLCRSSEPRDK